MKCTDLFWEISTYIQYRKESGVYNAINIAINYTTKIVKKKKKKIAIYHTMISIRTLGYTLPTT